MKVFGIAGFFTGFFTVVSTVVFAVVLMGSGQVALADPMEDVCHERAKKNSGYDGRRKGLTRQVGNTQMRLSGSVALGGSRSSGPPNGPRDVPSPAFAGQASTERREDKAKSKYSRIYNDCMRSR